MAVEGEDDDIRDVDAFAGLFFALDLIIVCFAFVKLFDSRLQKTEKTELPWSRGFQSLTLWGPLRQNRDNRCLLCSVFQKYHNNVSGTFLVSVISQKY